MAKLVFSQAEKRFLQNHEACRVATCHDDIPHVVPVSFIFINDAIYFATDYETRKFKNIQETGRVAVVIDEYASKGNKAICLQGTAKVIERGKEFQSLYKIFSSKFEWVKADPWKEGEAPFIKVIPRYKSSWGFRR